jgi:hypothetical protein
MRVLAIVVVAIACFLSLGCSEGGIILQPAQQGEWSNFKNDQHKVSKDARESVEKPPAEK